MKVVDSVIYQKFEFKPKGKEVKEEKNRSNYEEIITTIFKAKHDFKMEKNVILNVFLNKIGCE